MAEYLPPKRKSDVFNAADYSYSDGSNGDAISKRVKIVEDSLVSKANVNSPSFLGTVSGVTKSMVGLDNVDNTSDADKPMSTATSTALADATKEYTKLDQDFPAFDANVLAYYDFSSRTQPGRDFSGNGRHAKVLGGSIITMDDVTRTDILKLSAEYRSTVYASLINAYPAGMELDTFAPVIQRATFSTSFWIRWTPFNDASLPMVVWSICNPAVGATGLPGYVPSNFAWCWVRAGFLRLTTFVGGVQTFQDGFVLSTNTWTHVAITSTPGTNQTKFYKNGVLVSTTGTVDMTSFGAATSFTIGCSRASDQLPNSANTRQYCNNLQGELSDLMFTSTVLSASDVTKLYVDDYGMSIFPIAGQSNAVGQTPPTADDSDYSLITGKVYAYSIDGHNIVPATNPLPSGSQAGLWLQFCRDFVQNTSFPRKRKVMVIQCAIGGSAMANWTPSTVWYNRAVTAMTEAVGLNFLNKINGFLWNQGEAEMSAFNMVYKNQLLSMIAGFVAAVPTFTTATPKMMCEISSPSYDGYVNTGTNPATHMLSFMKSEMMSVAAADPTWAYVRSYDLSFTIESSYAVHYDSPSLKVLGGRYYDSLLKILGIPNIKLAGPVWGAIKALQTKAAAKAPLDSPNFTGTVTGVTKAMVQLGNVDNTSDAGKPLSTAAVTALGNKIDKAGGIAHGFLGFYNAHNTPMSNFGSSASGAICSNLSGGYGELDFVNNFGPANPGWLAFIWYYYTSATEKQVMASITYGGAFNVPGTITGPTITAINTNLVDLDNRVDILEASSSSLATKAPLANPEFTGYVGFNNVGSAGNGFYGSDKFGAICANYSGGDAELSFVNNGTGSSTAKNFSWFRATSSTTKTEVASLTGTGDLNVAGTITSKPFFVNLTPGSSTTETNASLKNVYMLTSSVDSTTTLTLPDLEPGDSKYNGWSIKIRTRNGGATQTLTLSCPASPNAFVSLNPGSRYGSKVITALNSYHEFVTVDGDYVELTASLNG